MALTLEFLISIARFENNPTKETKKRLQILPIIELNHRTEGLILERSDLAAAHRAAFNIWCWKTET